MHLKVIHFTLNTENSSSRKIKHWSSTMRITLNLGSSIQINYSQISFLSFYLYKEISVKVNN